jgi:two-component system response regulator PilR (NtrC family)
VIEIVVPPLRERRGDLPALCQALMARIAQESGLPVPTLSPDVLTQIAQHPLDGNVRELENLLHRAVALADGDELHVDAIAAAPTSEPPPATAATPGPAQALPLPDNLENWLDRQERDILTRALRETGFNRTAAAARLGLNLRQIRYRMARLNIAVPSGDEPSDEAA